MAGDLYLEDLHVGQRFAAGPVAVSADEIKSFAAEFDPQPFHLDEVAARTTPFKGLAASGWHTAVLTSAACSHFIGGLPRPLASSASAARSPGRVRCGPELRGERGARDHAVALKAQLSCRRCAARPPTRTARPCRS